jgi:RsiW-degrading membrane proteinase PrsW (M82 family)/CRP-like cAMP-binding protein
MFLAYMATITMPVVILFILHSYDTFGLQTRRSVIYALAWGGVAFILSFFVHQFVLNFTHYVLLVLIVAPIVEEVAKAAFIGHLLARGRILNVVDGLSIGFEIGLTFGMIENLIYLMNFTGTGSEAVGYAAARVLTAGLMHAFVTAMVGAVAGHSAHYVRRRQRLYFYGAVALAIFLHFAYNLVSLSFDGAWLLLIAMAIGMTGVGIIFVLIHREMRWVNLRVELLGSHSNQAARLAATDPQALRSALLKYEDVIGPEVLAKIERYAALVGQQAVLRLALDQHGTTRHREVIRVRLEDVQGQIAVLNADIGLFMRVWMGMLVASDAELQSAIEIAQLPTQDDPLLSLALTLAMRTRDLDAMQLNVRKTALAQSRLFGGLMEGDIEDVALMMDARPCHRGEIVLRRGEPNEKVYLVAAGAFELQLHAPDIGSVTVGTVKAGGAFGLASALGDRTVTSDVVCTHDGLTYVIGQGALLSLAYGNPRIGLVLVRHLAERVQNWGAMLHEATLQQRLATS